MARKGGGTAGKARKDIENKIGKSIFSPKNMKHLGGNEKKRLN